MTEDGIFVIDNGASTFIPLWSYIVENQVIDVLSEAGKRLYVIGDARPHMSALNGRTNQTPPPEQAANPSSLADRLCSIL